jgi:hypothetical protein
MPVHALWSRSTTVKKLDRLESATAYQSKPTSSTSPAQCVCTMAEILNPVSGQPLLRRDLIVEGRSAVARAREGTSLLLRSGCNILSEALDLH